MTTLLARLSDLLPKTTWTNTDLDADIVADQLDVHHVDYQWTWVDQHPLSMWRGYYKEEVLLVYQSEKLRVGSLHEIAPQLSLYQDLIVVGRDKPTLALFHHHHKALNINVPKLAPQIIRFYAVVDDYGAFSNFAPYPIVIDGKTWPTSEHYFQAQKFAGTPHEEQLRRVSSPMEVARMGRQRTRPLRRDWERVKIDIMRRALFAKFTQYDDLRTLLLETQDAKLIEHTTNDAFWGDGGDGHGQNWLGRLLMALREQLEPLE